ncbi:MAG: hypothetical protein WCF39_03540 [Pseudolabrys sp.]|jgi:hypothetical protein
MNVLLTGIALLLISFCSQLLLWRLWIPARQIRAILVIFLLAPLLAVAGALIAGVPAFLAAFTAPEITRLVIFYVSCSLVYVVLYSAIEEKSPTLSIVSYVAMKGECSEADLFGQFGKGRELSQRIELLTLSKLVECDDAGYRLAPGGRRFATLFDAANRLFGLELGG